MSPYYTLIAWKYSLSYDFTIQSGLLVPYMAPPLFLAFLALYAILSLFPGDEPLRALCLAHFCAADFSPLRPVFRRKACAHAPARGKFPAAEKTTKKPHPKGGPLDFEKTRDRRRTNHVNFLVFWKNDIGLGAWNGKIRKILGLHLGPWKIWFYWFSLIFLKIEGLHFKPNWWFSSASNGSSLIKPL